jgi:peptidoglycan/LPS O-acetylase OafA/YrhL
MGYCRFLLAISVLLVHLKAPVILSGFGGANSVELFYFISGFLMASILTKRYRTKRDFYINRILRIFPMYWIVLLLTFLFINLSSNKGFFLTQSDTVSLDLVEIIILCFMNVFILGSDILVFLNIDSLGNLDFVGLKNSQVVGTEYLLVSPIWSVSLELLFYLLAPLVMKFSNRVLAFVTLSLLFIRFISYFSGIDDDPWTYRFFPFELPIFLLGVLIFRFSSSLENSFRENNLIKFIKHPLFITVTFFAFGVYRSLVSWPRPLELLILLLIISVILIYSNNATWSNLIGRFSYPIYIVHFPIVFFLAGYRNLFSSYFGSSTTYWIGFQIFVVLVLSYFLILLTAPVEKLRNKLRSNSEFPNF